MEYGLWLVASGFKVEPIPSLNPCSNGIWSLTEKFDAAITICQSLNACSNGIWSLTRLLWRQPGLRIVLILVLMEYGLWLSLIRVDRLFSGVLILVLMEYGLWRFGEERPPQGSESLNPCSNGIWSLTCLGITGRAQTYKVLILVLMEYGLWRLVSAW